MSTVAKINRQKTTLGLPKIVSFLVIMMLFLSVATAQNEGQYTHFMFNRLSYNPAYAGSSGSFSITGLYRNQWMGLKLQPSVAKGESGTTPTDILVSLDLPVAWLHGGLGATFNKESYGFHDNVSIDLDYAFRIFWGKGNLAAAVEANLYNYNFDTKSLVGHDDMTGDFTSTAASSTDPLLTGLGESEFIVDFSTGLYYQVPSVYYVSLSVKNLLGSKSEKLNIQNARTLYLMAGYEYRFPYNTSFTVKPSMLVKTADFSIFQADFACLLDYRNFFWGGMGYRWGDAFTFLAGVNFFLSDQRLQFGVAYDLTTSRLGYASGRSFGSLELFINANIQIEIPQKPPSTYRNTRY